MRKSFFFFFLFTKREKKKSYFFKKIFLDSNMLIKFQKLKKKKLEVGGVKFYIAQP